MTVSLPAVSVAGRAVVLLDDVANTGGTLASGARAVLAAGAASVDMAVTPARFVGDAQSQLHVAGGGRVWSTDCVPQASNGMSVVPLLARALAAWPVAAPLRLHPCLPLGRHRRCCSRHCLGVAKIAFGHWLQVGI